MLEPMFFSFLNIFFLIIFLKTGYIKQITSRKSWLGPNVYDVHSEVYSLNMREQVDNPADTQWARG